MPHRGTQSEPHTTPAAPLTAAAGAPTPAGRRALPYHPAFGRAVSYTAEPRPAGNDDEAGTAQTIARMFEYSTADAQDPFIRAAAAEATSGRRGQLRQLAGIFEHVRRQLRYVDDKQLAFFRPVPDDAEVLIRPADLARMDDPQGDCDEYSMFARALILAAGMPADFVAVEADPDAPGAYSHVYVMAYPRAGAVAFDAIPAAGGALGWEIRPTGKRRVFHAQGTMTKPTTSRASRRALVPTEILMPRTLGALDDESGVYFPDTTTTTITLPGGVMPSPAPPYVPPSSSPTSGGSGFNWQSWAQALTADAAGILGTRYAVPQLNPGQVIRNADGSVLYQAPAGQPIGSNILGASGGSTGLLLLAAAAVIAIFAMKGGN